MSKLIITSLVNSGLFQALNTTEQQSTTGDIKLEATLFQSKEAQHVYNSYLWRLVGDLLLIILC